jgi:2-polyprenyl-6-methoxyphenol hydroxylase-like FAD-dependent oxidoreductase
LADRSGSIREQLPEAVAVTDNQRHARHRRCVIVGGGPVGLATALTMSSPPHCFNVTVLEKTSDAEFVGMYDPTKAYLYNINPRGLQWIRPFPAVLRRVLNLGYSPESGLGKIMRVPGDPGNPIAPSKDVAIAGNVTFDPSSRSVWIPRHLMVELMMTTCVEHDEWRRSAGSNSSSGSISIGLGKAFASMLSREDGSLCVSCQDGSTYEADLVVGADGINSAVREFLADSSSPTNQTQPASWLHASPRSFRVQSYRSPSSGLRLKSLQLPGDFCVPNTTESRIQSEGTSLIVMESVNKGPDSLSLGLLPIKNEQFVRPANVITRPDHKVWSITDGPTMKKWFEASFPRLPWDEWVNASEWQRFAQTPGITYPEPQFSRGSVAVAPMEQTGVVLVGDACHAFPPDIGQGINSGLQDVVALDRVLQGKDIRTGDSSPGTAPTLGQALRIYQRNRGPEHRALIRVARFGAPYQFRQAWSRDRVGRKLWFANFLMRVLLNKLTLGLVPPPAAVLMSDSNIFSFREVMRRCDSFNWAVRGALLALATRWICSRFGILH